MTDQVLGRITNRAIFIILSDFLTDADWIQSSLARFKHQRQDVLCLQILDEQEINFDFGGPEHLQDLEDDQQVKIDPRSIKDAYLKSLRDHLDKISQSCNQFGYDHLVMNSHNSVGPALGKLLARRSLWQKRRRSG